ncbi:MAG: carbamoyl-phosphate synthase large subunit, partial [Verrucomicrobiota bacterium]
ACEFDYSGVQACKALKEENYKVILVNSNPATIMTDPEFADRTYVEPITPEAVELIIEKEKPDALLPTLGGQTALNTAMALYEKGILEKHNVEMIGAKADAIRKGEDRQVFKDLMIEIGLDVPLSGTAHNLQESIEVAKKIGRFPVITRPAFTLGGTGGGVAYNWEEFEELATRGLDLSPTTEILIEESLLGWKEYEMEVVRDKNDNCIVICSIENFDPMGVHTGDSITVAPAQTLSDKEFQYMRDASFAVIRAVGVETGGSNIQFSLDPDTGRMIVIEMNPRVSRSSALASKATGFPIAKIAAKLAVGYTLDELQNDITKDTPASFEPTIDYVVTKIPRFTFEKFSGSDSVLTSQMKSVGEAMAIGRTFKESFQKAVRSLDLKGRDGTLALGNLGKAKENEPEDLIRSKLRTPNNQRLWWVMHAFQNGFAVEEVHQLSRIDRWFLENMKQIFDLSLEIEGKKFTDNKELLPLLEKAKSYGFSDKQIAELTLKNQSLSDACLALMKWREQNNIKPSYRLVDTCAAEFEAYTPYFYSTYDRGDDEHRLSEKKKIIILGGGPNRIGQGIEFDYCCVHASLALQEQGFETIMINSNPETVSTDYDISDKLYFEPLTVEDVYNIYQAENANDSVLGVIVQFGGQTPLNLAAGLAERGVKIIGTSVESIARAEDRKLFQEMLHKLNLRQPVNATATDYEAALKAAHEVGYPVLMRPSFVLGGRAMQIVYNDDELLDYMRTNQMEVSAERPILLDQFLDDATEIDVDCLAEGSNATIGAIMEHIERAGVHSGDSACTIPPYSLKPEMIETIRSATLAMAKELEVRGLMNVQYAVKDDVLYVIEVNPRASRTVPFVSKAVGVPLAKYASRIMAGESLSDIGFDKEVTPDYFCIKEAVFPFAKFRGVDILLGPEMKSTGEVMGIDPDFGLAYGKAQMAAQPSLPTSGKVFISVRDQDKAQAIEMARTLTELGFEICSTHGTARSIANQSIAVTPLLKLAEGRPNIIDLIKNGEISLVINTPASPVARQDEVKIRTSALYNHIPVMTTMAAAEASIKAIAAIKDKGLSIKPLQEYHA